jgi:DNA-binding MarR family transcriptional regulator
MLDRSLTYHLSAITEDGIGNANHIFEARFGWSVRELRVLRIVRSTPGITFTTLAALTKFDRSLASRLLSSLIKAGLIGRTAPRMRESSRSRPPARAKRFAVAPIR